MPQVLKILIQLTCLTLLSGCVTNDFKVVVALHPGMSPTEAKATIESYGFTLETSLSRPEDGWLETGDTFDNLAPRAHWTEQNKGIKVHLAEYYPVTHGLLGFGQLFLFYDKNLPLVSFYRRQIN